MRNPVQHLWITADETAGDPMEQRRHRRHTVMLRATLYPIDMCRDIIVHDVSLTGIQGETDIELTLGQVLHLSFDETVFQEGVVKWVKGARFGLKLEEQIALPVVPAEYETTDDPLQQPRARRVGLNLGARIAAGRPPRPAMVRNVSATGMMIETSPGLLEGQSVILRIPGSPNTLGRVQWTSGPQLGIKTG
jgi:hypothetical protein